MENTVNLVCPITHKPFVEPVLLSCDGYTYEKRAIEEWISSGAELTPMGLPLSSNHQLIRNIAIRNIAIRNKTVFRDPILVGENGLTYEHTELLAMVEETIKMDRPIELEGMRYHSIQCYQNKTLWLDAYDSERQSQLASKYSHGSHEGICGHSDSTRLTKYTGILGPPEGMCVGCCQGFIKNEIKLFEEAHPGLSKKEQWKLAAEAWEKYKASPAYKNREQLVEEYYREKWKTVTVYCI